MSCTRWGVIPKLCGGYKAALESGGDREDLIYYLAALGAGALLLFRRLAT